MAINTNLTDKYEYTCLSASDQKSIASTWQVGYNKKHRLFNFVSHDGAHWQRLIVWQLA
jgi:hypothetical protein